MVNQLHDTVNCINTTSRSSNIILHISFEQSLAHKTSLLNFNIQKPRPHDWKHSQQQLAPKGLK